MTTGPTTSHRLDRLHAFDGISTSFDGLVDYEKSLAEHQKALDEYDQKFAEYLANPARDANEDGAGGRRSRAERVRSTAQEARLRPVAFFASPSGHGSPRPGCAHRARSHAGLMR